MFDQQRIAMVDGQLRTNKITDERVIDLFLTLPREEFAPDGLKGSAYVDEDIDLGQGRSLMEPLVAARMLQHGEIEAGMTALVIGAGNGYLPRLLLDLGLEVTALEAAADLAEQGKAAAVGATWAVQELGSLPDGSFDRIFVGGAIPEIPAAWSKALAPGGQIIAPIAGARGNDGQLVIAVETNGLLSSRSLCNAAVPALPEFTQAPGFSL